MADDQSKKAEIFKWESQTGHRNHLPYKKALQALTQFVGGAGVGAASGGVASAVTGVSIGTSGHRGLNPNKI